MRTHPCARNAALVGGFVDTTKYICKLDRNAKARLLHAARVLEAKTRSPGKGNGIITRPGLAILEALLFCAPQGRPIFPSWRWLQDRLGYCRTTIAKAMTALEAARIVERHQRLTRDELGRCRQSSNLYTVKPMATIHVLPMPAPAKKRASAFPRSTGVQITDTKPTHLVFDEKALHLLRPLSTADWRERGRQALIRG